MINETEEQLDIETKYFDRDQKPVEKVNHMYSYGKNVQLLMVRKLSGARRTDCLWKHAALTVRLPRSVIFLDAEDSLLCLSRMIDAS